MKSKIGKSLVLVLLLFIIITSTVNAQYAGFTWSTAYQVVNMGSGNTTINVDYYDSAGNVVTAAHKQYVDVPAGASRLVVQFTDDPNLSGGRYSAVVSSDREPVAAVVNQQLVASGSTSYNPVPPFSSYSGVDEGSASVFLPAVAYNWYGYYTELYIMNIGTGTASNVDISYVPGSISGVATGNTGITDLNNTIPLYASITKSQQSLTTLGAPSGTYKDRFLGSAKITSDQPIVVIVNEHNPNVYKLFSYNGFPSSTDTDIAAPQIMRGYFGYYTTMTIANPSDSQTAAVQIIYTPSGAYNTVTSGSVGPVSVNYNIDPNTALTRYDGPDSKVAQSDLNNYSRFFGSAEIKSTNGVPIVVEVNIEAVSTGDDQAGAYDGASIASATQNIVAPTIAADYYGYYTTMTVQNVTGVTGSCSVSYTSDSTYSAVKNQSKAYNHTLPANGAFTVYEGRKGGQQVGDINSDVFWQSGGQKQFIGSASITCTVNAVAFVNEEKDISQKDSMYTYNAFNK